MALRTPNSDQKLRALAVQLIERDEGVILKRGCTEFRVAGPKSKETVHGILLAVAEGGATSYEICASFPVPYQAAVRELVHELTARRILVVGDSDEPATGQESALDVFYWHFGFRAEEVTARLQATSLAIIGVNCISRQILASLSATGVTSAKIIDYPLLRNIRFFNQEGELDPRAWPGALDRPIPYADWEGLRPDSPPLCLVATSDFGGLQLMRQWNQYCVEEGAHFLPVVLQNLIGYVGPLVVPGETACFECLRARQNSHLSDPKLERVAEHEAFAGQFVSGFHPSMASILGDIAVLELTKLYGRVPLWRVGTLIEVSLLAPSLVARKVLKIPRCPVCSPLHRRSSVTFDSVTYLPPNEHATVE